MRQFKRVVSNSNSFKSLVGGLLLSGLLGICSDALPAPSAMESPTPPQNIEEGITLSEEQAVKLFYERNLDLLAARYNIGDAQAREIIASAIPNPTITIQTLELSRNSNQNSPSQGCNGAGGGNNSSGNNCGPAAYYSFSQLIEMAGKRGLRMQSSAIGTQAAESDFRDAIRILTNMIRDSYYTLLQAQKNRWLLREVVKHFKEIVHSMELRLQAGDIAEADFLRINMEALKAQSDLDNAQAQVEQAQGNMAVVLNWPDKSMQFLAEEKLPEIRDIGQNLSRESLTNKALSLRPDLQGDKLRADQADKDLALSQRLKYPDVTVSAGYARDPSNTILNTAFVGVSLPVPIFYQYEGETSKASVNLNQTRLQAQETEIAIRNDVVASLASYRSADKVVRRFEGEMLHQARQVRDRTELAYQKGATTILDLIDVQRNFKTITLEYYAAVINRINAYYDLAKSIGDEPNPGLANQMGEENKLDHLRPIQ